MNCSRCVRILLAGILLITSIGSTQAQGLLEEIVAKVLKAPERQSARELLDKLAKEGMLSKAADTQALEAIYSEPKKYFAGTALAFQAKRDFSQLQEDACRTLVANGQQMDYLLPDDASVVQLLERQNAARPLDQRVTMTLREGNLNVSSPGAWLDATVDMRALKAHITRLAIAVFIADKQSRDSNGPR